MTTATMTKARTNELVLSDEQESAVTEIIDWYVDDDAKRVFKLHGYAGTGKTTVLKEVVSRLTEAHPDVRMHFAAFTGKAAHVMRSKGLEVATTLHTGGLIWQTRKSSRTGNRYFHPLGKGDAVLDSIDLLIVDECSMLGPDLLTRIMHHPDPADLFNDYSRAGGRRKNLRVLAVGDPAQLWPIPDRGEAAEPSPWAKEGGHTFRLETIHRSAEGSPILQAASAVRGPNGRDFGEMWNRLSIGTKPDVSALLRADQIITYKNDTRWYVVDLLRKAKGMPQGEPAMGDRLVMLRNSDLGVNGEQVEVSCAIRSRMPASEKWSEFDYFTVGFSDGRSTDVPASMFEDRAGEAEGLRLSYKTGMTALTFADAITCHKAQGSEWDSVLVVDEGYMSAQSPGWHYTAITRAREYAGIVSVDHLPTAWTRHEAAVFRDEWWESIWDSDLSHTVKVTALAIVEAVEDEDTIRVRADTEHIGGLIDRSVSTVNTHMTKLRKAGCLKGKGSLTMLHFSGGLKPPSTLKQLHALMARQALADEPETRAHVS